MTPLKDLVRTLRRDIRGLQKVISRVSSSLDVLERRGAQAKALQELGSDAPVWIARLEQLLDLDRVADHARSTVRQAQLRRDPVPHMVISDVLPPDVYAAVVDAMPGQPFFDEEAGHATELAVPLRLAPTHTIVTTAFLNEVVRTGLSPALLDGFNDSFAAYTRVHYPSLPEFGAWDVELSISQPRLMRRSPGQVPEPADRPWDLLTGVLMVARPGDTSEFGGRLGATKLAFRGNTLIVFNAPAETLTYDAIPQDAPPDTARYSYEFGIGPTRDGRRRLEVMMRNSARTA